jgi:hypothetical protein
VIDGKGVWYYANGDTYEGEFTENKMSGRGTLTYRHPSDESQGHSVDGGGGGGGGGNGSDGGGGGDRAPSEMAALVSRMEGAFVKGRLNGEGTTYFRNGSTHTGAYQRGKAHGVGRFVACPGASVDGDVTARGDVGVDARSKVDADRMVVWEGEFANNAPTGLGTITFADARTLTETAPGKVEPAI